MDFTSLQTYLGLAQILAIGFAIAAFAVTYATVRKLRRPPRRTYGWSAARGLPGTPDELQPPRAHEERAFDTAKGPLASWVIEGDDPDGLTILCWPGWGDSAIGVLTRMGALAPAAKRVVAIDPPWHGETHSNTGYCALGAHEPALLVEIARALEKEMDANERFALYGWSLGAGVCIEAAREIGDRVSCVLAEAPYDRAQTPARNVLRLSGLPWRINLPLAYAWMGLRLGRGLRWQRFSRSADAKQLPGRCPLLVIHGDADVVSPLADGEAIADAAPNGSLVTVPGGGHNNLWTDDRFRGFATEAFQRFLAGKNAPPA